MVMELLWRNILQVVWKSIAYIGGDNFVESSSMHVDNTRCWVSRAAAELINRLAVKPLSVQ